MNRWAKATLLQRRTEQYQYKLSVGRVQCEWGTLVWTVPRLMQECFVHLFTINDTRLWQTHCTFAGKRDFVVILCCLILFHFSFFVFLLCLRSCSACTTTTYCANVNVNVCASGSRAREKRNDHNRKSHTCVAPLVSAALRSSARHYSKSTWNTHTHTHAPAEAWIPQRAE